MLDKRYGYAYIYTHTQAHRRALGPDRLTQFRSVPFLVHVGEAPAFDSDSSFMPWEQHFRGRGPITLGSAGAPLLA